MTQNVPDQETSQPTRIEKIRASVMAGLGRIFAGPYLPISLIAIILLLIMTEAGVALINQPADYWLDHGRATGAPLLQRLLNAGPIVYAGAYLVYAALIALVLGLLNYRPALLLWLSLGYYHISAIRYWLQCGLNGLFDLSSNNAICAVYSSGIVIAFAVAMGIVLVRTFGPLETLALGSSPRRKFSWRIVALPAIYLVVLLVGVIWASRAPETGWKPISVAQYPKGRVDGMIAYDTKRNKAIMFGGASEWLGNQWLFEHDTWEWDGTGWTQLFPPESPSGRIGHGLAYDEARGVVVLFGGYNQDGALGDTWEWDGKEWHQKCPACSPPARSGHQIIYDPQRSKVVLYGGYDWQETFFDDAWEWNGETWRQIVLDSPSPAASSFGLVYAKGQNRAVAFLGGSGATWAWEAGQWSRLELASEPPRRSNAGTAYDSSRGYIVLFGGRSDDVFFNDTWIFDGVAWKEFRSALHPTARSAMSLFYDVTRKRIVLFGGLENATFHNDMWELVLPEK